MGNIRVTWIISQTRDPATVVGLKRLDEKSV